MFVARENDAERRLDRLESEARRRQVDSALMVRRADGTTARTPPQATRVAPQLAAPPADDAALLALMAERINMLERQSTRLESEVRRWQRKGKTRGRLALGAAFVAALVMAGGAAWALVPNPVVQAADPVR